jgi:apolipoprotein N-acyltransferase
MALGFAPFNLWPVIFISLPIFYILLSASERLGQALWRGFYFGYGYFMAGTWWIANSLLVDADKFAWMLPFSILGLSAAMAAWFVVFGFLVYRCRRFMSPPLFAALWVVVEYLRTFGMFGFPWNLLGYMGLSSLSFAQIASLIGTYGLSFLLLLVALTPLYWLQSVSKLQRYAMTVLAVMLLALCYGYGAQRLKVPSGFTETVLRVVQPNIPQEVKGTHAGRDIAIDVLGRLTNQRSGTRVPDVTIWPETAYPFTVRVGEEQSVPKVNLLITGAIRAEGFRPVYKIWNSIVVMGVEGDVITTYDKHQLVPFGEFVPLRTILPLDKITPGDVDFSRGHGVRTIQVEGLPSFSPVICYEAIFPWMAVDSNTRPQWLLNVTNDGWFGVSAGPYQHLAMARMRAIEQGLPLVRAANSGVSVVTDSYGRVLSSLGLNQRGAIDIRLPIALPATAYAKHREVPMLALLLLIFVLTFLQQLRTKNK